MFEKLFNALFTKKERSGVTVLSEKRGIGREYGALKREDLKGFRCDEFWNNRGRLYGTLFNSLNGRDF